MSRPRTRSPSARRPLCSYSLVIHGREAADRGGRLLGEVPLDVQVVDVDRRRDRDLVAAKPVGVVQARPGVLRQDLGGRPMGAQPAVVLPHPREDVLRREEPLGLDLVGQQPLGRPARRDAVRVGRLVERGVDRVPLEPDAGLGVVQEGRRAERQLDDVVEQLEAGAVAEPERRAGGSGARSVGRPTGAGRPRRRAGGGCRGPGRGRPGSARSSARFASIRGRVGRARRRRRRAPDRRQAAGDERLAQALGGERQVGHRRRSRRSSGRGRSSDRRRARAGSARRRGRSSRRGSGSGTRPARPGVSPGSRRPASSGRCRAGRGAAPGSRGARASASRGRAEGSAGWPRSPGPPWRNTRYGRSRPSGAATSRVKTVIAARQGARGRAAAVNSRSVRTSPGPA